MSGKKAALRFCGGAGTVTGSKYHIQYDGVQVLLDAGMFQGLKELRLRNWSEPPFDPAQIHAVILSHAHIDHSGYLPVLVRKGFRGPIYCTAGTQALLEVLLPDAAYLQQEEANYANKAGFSQHKPALPLFSAEDADKTLRQLRVFPYGEEFEAAGTLKARFRRAGHILGSALVEAALGKDDPVCLVFSGDLGRWNQPVIRDPELIAGADVLLLESTYGDRVHPPDPLPDLARVIRETAERRGVLIIPAFAVGRTQELIWMIRDLEQQNKIPVLPIYADSPMAINVTDIYCRIHEDHDLKMEELSKTESCPLHTQKFSYVRDVEEVKKLHGKDGPMVIISASGMATGGRVLHHLKNRLPDPMNTVLFTGYQAEGTRGRSLQEGAGTVKIHGQQVPVRARIETVDGLSAHADQKEILRWLSGFKAPPRETYLVHGEKRASERLAQVIRHELGWKVQAARDGETVLL
ncbi:MAG: MBL fold metallo-hydrolase [Candidatus Omnitrophica bacterium]|nr:MBL fold metallo-hydrolase [Candidatus Omnitrophota bacterium]